MIMSKKKNICSIILGGVAALGRSHDLPPFGGKRVGAGDGYFFRDFWPVAETI